MQNKTILYIILAIIASFLFPKQARGVTLTDDDIMLPIDYDIPMPTDASSLISRPDSLSAPDGIYPDWKTLLRERRLDINDPNVKFPGFIEFCLRIYRWGEAVFNTYDPEWVGGTGKHGKVRLVSDNWVALYNFRFEKTPMLMSSNIFSNLGIQANYSILSLSYSADLNSAFTGKKSNHKKLGVSFSCARMYLEGYFWEDKGGINIDRIGFGDTSTGVKNVDFDGLKFRALGVLGFYIFNSRRFSFAAAYNLSNHQLRSAGSWLAGATGTFYNADFDFTLLPPEAAEATRFPFDKYNLNYNSVNLMGGYSYNWVMNRHLLFNTTTLPGLGISFSHANSTPGRKTYFSATIRQMLSLTYTNRSFFITASGSFHGNLFLEGQVSFSSGIGNFQLSSGVRF